MIAKRHMHQYGTTREQLAMFSVINHKNGALNPLAQFPMEITVDQVLNSSIVADPLRLLDCSPVTDGAAAVILCPAEEARKYTDTPIYVKASAQAVSYTHLDVYKRQISQFFKPSNQINGFNSLKFKL